MAKKSFAENLTNAQLLVKGLQGRQDNLPLGVTSEMIAEVDNLSKEAVTLNAEQEKLKALQKEKTAQLDIVTKKLHEKQSHIKKYIKIGVKQELWREFGIEDKR